MKNPFRKRSKKNETESNTENQKIKENKLNMRMMAAFIREIHTPVSDLCGLSNLMCDVPEDASIYHYAKSMNTCGLLLADMIENMRIYYLLQSDLYELNISSFVLRAEIIGAWNKVTEEHDMFSQYQEESQQIGDIECNLEISRDVPAGLVESDSFCILKIFSCILSNAIRFTMEGSVTMDIYMTQETNEEVLHMVISDTGVGVPPEVSGIIFNPLTKAHTESIHGGVGMGLPVSRSMCIILGGDLVMESDGGSRGSTFHAFFPISYDGNNEISKSHHEEVTLMRHGEKPVNRMSVLIEGDDEPSTSEMPKILLVEDVKLIRDIVSKMMRDAGVVIDLAEDGVYGVEECRKKQYDLVLMDIIMPIMGGMEAVAKIRSECPLNEKTPIIALTGILAGKIKSKCIRNGMADCIQKPVKRKELVEMVSLYLQPIHKKWILENSTI